MSSILIIQNALYLGDAVDIVVRDGKIESVTPHEEPTLTRGESYNFV